MKKLSGKTAIVTGAGRGIGRAIASKLANEGAQVLVNDLDAQPAEETVEQIRASGGVAVALSGNVVEPHFGTRLIETALQCFGGLDIIVNNAGYTWDSVIQKMTDEQFQAMLDVHLVAPFRILRAALEPVRALARAEAAQGREVRRKVVNVSSVAATEGNPGQVNYSAAKAGVIGMTRSLAKEWGRYGVTVNCVAFGYIQTRLTQPIDGESAQIEVDGRKLGVGVPRARIEAAGTTIPLGRGGTPEEAAGAVYLFCIPESDYVSGQTLVCGGGR